MAPQESATFMKLNQLAAEYIAAKPERKKEISALFDQVFPNDVQPDNAA
jgi:hypothetical protein